MRKCTLCNEDFFMTNDSCWQVVAEEEDMERLDSPCHWCTKEVKENCKTQLISIITKKPLPDVDATALINKYKQNGDNIQNWINKDRIRKLKKHN